MAKLIVRVLNDAVLGFLALSSLFLMIAPLVFDLAGPGELALAAAEHVIVCLFALEYVSAFSLASDKWEFVSNRWRILDALIIAAPIFALFPFGPDALRSSPALRLARLARVALLGTRSGLGLSTLGQEPVSPVASGTSRVEVLALGASGMAFEPIDYEDGLRRIANAEPAWLFASGCSQDRLAPIADALKVPEKAVQGLFQASVPRLDRLEQFSTLFVRYPLPPGSDGRLRRSPVLLIGTSDNVVVLCRDLHDLARRVEDRLPSIDASTPRMVRATVALIHEILGAYGEVVERLEISLLQIEADQSSLRDEAFLLRTSELRSDILRVRSSLKHLRKVARDLAEGQTSLPSTTGEPDRNAFLLLAEDAGDLSEAIEDVRDSLQNLVDVRLNVSSFQMNRVMRLLALLTALALIPATAGGLLGMNLQDTPWPGTLGQVSFGVGAGMALSLYLFAIKGWLR